MLPYNYLVPALYFNATVQTAVSLGNLATGGGLIHAHAITGTLRSEPGFEPSFTAAVLYGEDYPTIDASGSVVRSDLRALVVPDDGDTPFQMHATGILFPNADVNSIIVSNTTSGLAVPYGAIYSVWVPSFRGGSAKYANLQTSVFVASETVSDGAKPGEFVVGMKISKVFCINTTVVIGQEFP